MKKVETYPTHSINKIIEEGTSKILSDELLLINTRQIFTRKEFDKFISGEPAKYIDEELIIVIPESCGTAILIKNDGFHSIFDTFITDDET